MNFPKERIVLVLFVASTTLLAATTTNIYFLQLKENQIGEKNFKNVTKSSVDSSSISCSLVRDHIDEQNGDYDSRIVFFLGMAFGSVAAGVVGRHLGASKTAQTSTKLFVAANLLFSRLSVHHRPLKDLSTFLLSASMQASFLSLCIEIVEICPSNWTTFVGLAVFSSCWPLGRTICLLLFRVADSAEDVTFWNALAALTLIFCRDLAHYYMGTSTKAVDGRQAQHWFNLLRQQRVFFLSVLWLCQGFTLYSTTWLHMASGTMWSKLFVALMTMLAKAHTTTLVLWLAEKRTILSVLTFLTFLSSFGILGSMASADFEWCRVTASPAFIVSGGFLISGSWNLLWLTTIESFGPGVR